MESERERMLVGIGRLGLWSWTIAASVVRVRVRSEVVEKESKVDSAVFASYV